MFIKLLFVLLANLTCFSHGTPVETLPQHEMSQFFNARIVGGIEAPPEYGKHMAALVFGERMTHLLCGGTIVTKHHILTAAHCIESVLEWHPSGIQLMSSFRAVIGSNEWASTKKNIRFTGYKNHPGWDWGTIKNDIGVLFLAEEIKLSHNVAIIPLGYDWVDGGAECYVTGWGRLGAWANLPDKLQLLYVHTLSEKQCLKKIREAAGEWGHAPPYDHRIEICTFHSFGHGMCNGDSGSGLIHTDTQKQIGIVSWGFPCAIGAPDVFVRVAGFKDWLKPIIGKYV